MPWKGHHHLSTNQPATAGADCKEHIIRERPDPKPATNGLPPRADANRIVLGRALISSWGSCMMSDKGNLPDTPPKRHYTWPWFVLGAVLLAIALAVLWMSKEIERTRRIRDLNAPAPPSGSGAPVAPR